MKGQLLILIKIEWTEGLRSGQCTLGSNKRHHHKARQGLLWKFKSPLIPGEGGGGGGSTIKFKGVIAVSFRG